MNLPRNVQLVGNEVAIAWDDGGESYFESERLRAASPSAETQGERDILRDARDEAVWAEFGLEGFSEFDLGGVGAGGK